METLTFQRGENNEGMVLLNGVPLDWAASLEHRDHSPTGVEWGYHGSGPSQCALVVLLAITDPLTALFYYQDFKRECIAPIPYEGQTIDLEQIRLWLSVKEDVRRLNVEAG